MESGPWRDWVFPHILACLCSCPAPCPQTADVQGLDTLRYGSSHVYPHPHHTTRGSLELPAFGATAVGAGDTAGPKYQGPGPSMDPPSPVGQHHKEHCGVPCPPNKVESLESERWDSLHRSHTVQEVLRRGCPVQWFPPRVKCRRPIPVPNPSFSRGSISFLCPLPDCALQRGEPSGASGAAANLSPSIRAHNPAPHSCHSYLSSAKKDELHPPLHPCPVSLC